MANGRKTGGRAKGTPNRATAELKTYAQQYDKETIDFLVGVMRGTRTIQRDGVDVVEILAADFRERVAAARELLDRAHGKPAQAITDADGGNLTVPQAVTFVLSKAPGADTRK